MVSLVSGWCAQFNIGVFASSAVCWSSTHLRTRDSTALVVQLCIVPIIYIAIVSEGLIRPDAATTKMLIVSIS